MNTNEITVTEGRLKQAIDGAVDMSVGNKISQQITNAVENEKIKTGVITKFYPYLDKAEVKLDSTGQTILCKILHRYGGDIIDFYTPLEDQQIFDEKLKEPAIIPRSAQHVCVLSIQDADSIENLILGYYQNEEVVGFKPASPGNIKLMSITEPNLYWISFGRDGLECRVASEPTISSGKLKNEMEDIKYANTNDVYTKEEVDEKLKNDNSSVYSDLLDVTQKYKETSSDKYYLFRGDCFTINNNYESSAAITSTANDNLTVTGTFRTKNDLIGIYWNSDDPIEHPYISYGSRYDYTDVTLDFDYEMTGCKDFSNNIISITIGKTDGSVYYLQMNRFIDDGHVSIDFNELTLLAGNTYINAKGQSITVTEETPVDVTDIKFIMFVIVPTNYVENNTQYTIMENADFTCEITKIEVTNGDICNEHVPLEPHKYRLCEGYDDFYNLNPRRVCKEMRKLGYVEWCDLYIGASHYYEKSGTPDDVITDLNFNHNRTEKMVLNPDVPLNKAFRKWLDCYSRELKANGTDKLIISVSMENLQCPTNWRQKDCNGNYAVTGWIPSTFFYSPCNNAPVTYMQNVSEACLDIVVNNNMQPILQMGEAWWWWNENDRPNQPPCFYDLETRNKYLAEFGHSIPEYAKSNTEYYDETAKWLNRQLSNYVDKLREVVKKPKYTNGLYFALFFPPSVTDVDRVPELMRKVNYIKSAYCPNKLDVLQLEDYDWVTGESPHHDEVYTLGEKLGFTNDKVHYFGGFVQYPQDSIKFWKLIKQSMEDAFEKGFKEVFVWAGSQVRRDHKIIGYDNYELVQQLINGVK